MHHNQRLGRFGEQLAAEYLVERGLTVLTRNWRCPEGEIDIVALEGKELLFVEVKTRSSRAYGHPFEAVTSDKANRLHRLALRWKQETRDPRKFRIDLIAVLFDSSGAVTIERLQAVR